MWMTDRWSRRYFLQFWICTVSSWWATVANSAFLQFRLNKWIRANSGMQQKHALFMFYLVLRIQPVDSDCSWRFCLVANIWYCVYLSSGNHFQKKNITFPRYFHIWYVEVADLTAVAVLQSSSWFHKWCDDRFDFIISKAMLKYLRWTIFRTMILFLSLGHKIRIVDWDLH